MYEISAAPSFHREGLILVAYGSWEGKPNLYRMDPGREPVHHALQQVSTIQDQRTVISWMVDDETVHGMRGLYACTIQAFPAHFRGQQNTNLIRVSRWWALQDRYFLVAEVSDHQTLSYSRNTLNKRKQVLNKVGAGRGPKHSKWVDWIYPWLLLSFKT